MEEQPSKRRRQTCDGTQPSPSLAPSATPTSTPASPGVSGRGRGSPGRGCGLTGRGRGPPAPGRGPPVSGRGCGSVPSPACADSSAKKMKNMEKKKKKKGGKEIAKAEAPNVLTPKQQKKARARGRWRKNKKDQQQQKVQGQDEGSAAGKEKSSKSKQKSKNSPTTDSSQQKSMNSTTTVPSQQRSKNSTTTESSQPESNGSTTTDPSQLYIGNPMSAPRVTRAAALFKSLSIPFPVIVGPSMGWRTHSKLAVRNDSQGRLTIGLFEPNSHEVVDASSSPAHHKSINKTVKALIPLCKSSHVTAYSEKDGNGMLKYVVLNVERQTDNMQLTLIVNADESMGGKEKSCIDALCKSIVEADGDIPLHSLFLHFNKVGKHGNNIFSMAENSWKHVHGPEYLTEVIAEQIGCPYEVVLNFPPNVFRQANLTAFASIVKSAREYLVNRGCKKCVELYGGVGTLGFHFVDVIEGLVCSDKNPNNQAAFDKTRKGLEKTLRKKVERYVELGAEGMVQSGRLAAESVDVVVVDPPRKGLDEHVLDEINTRKNIKTLIYISCGLDAFMKDFKALRRDGCWKAVQAGGWVLFPGADHIETLSIMERT